jgi:ABC-2 type transport system permease protein
VAGERVSASDIHEREQNWWKQVLHLSRAEFIQLRRARITLFYLAGLPVLLAVISFSTQGLYTDSGEHVDGGAASLFTMMPVLAATMGLLHVSNLFTVRREQHILKRLRVGGAAASAMFAAVCVPTLAFVLTVTAILCAIGIAAAGQFPAAPELLLIAVILSSVTMSLFGIWITRYARTAESMQMISFIPLILLLFGSGATLPLEFMSDRFAQVVWFSPLAPLVDLFRSAYFGADFFGGRITQVPPLDRVELWTGALPALGVSLAWALISCYLVRSVLWTARRT